MDVVLDLIDACVLLDTPEIDVNLVSMTISPCFVSKFHMISNFKTNNIRILCPGVFQCP